VPPGLGKARITAPELPVRDVRVHRGVAAGFQILCAKVTGKRTGSASSLLAQVYPKIGLSQLQMPDVI
jgi:hypothetical protein